MNGIMARQGRGVSGNAPKPWDSRDEGCEGMIPWHGRDEGCHNVRVSCPRTMGWLLAQGLQLIQNQTTGSLQTG